MLSFFCLISFHLFFKYFHLKRELGYPIGIILDKGQALIDDDLSNYTKLWIVPEKSTYLMERFLISNVISI